LVVLCFPLIFPWILPKSAFSLWISNISECLRSHGCNSVLSFRVVNYT
jgi:hypothetical protein